MLLASYYNIFQTKLLKTKSEDSYLKIQNEIQKVLETKSEDSYLKIQNEIQKLLKTKSEDSYFKIQNEIQKVLETKSEDSYLKMQNEIQKCTQNLFSHVKNCNGLSVYSLFIATNLINGVIGIQRNYSSLWLINWFLTFC